MNAPLPSRLAIRSGQGDYPVDFLETPAEAVPLLQEAKHRLFLVDENVAQLYAKDLAALTAGAPLLTVPATEDEKTLPGITRVLDFLQRHNATKQSVVVAIGGGVIQDIATFSAHLYYRGLRWIYLPTTLLGMCDSCIGAKCGINLNGFKNQLGVFHSPARVILCRAFLDTLPDAEIASGYGEILKLLLTGSPELFALLRRAVAEGGLRNPQLPRLIYESLQVKKQVIEEDEYERDLRRILNYGHTFGHALEAITHHEIPHGKAVAWGVDLVNYLALRRGLLPEGEYREIHAFIREHFSHRIGRSVTARELIDGTRRDKKIEDGRINLILLQGTGTLRIVPSAYDAQLEQDVADYLARENVVSWN